ncbi:MAG: DUF4412 domain-containing protein [Deltaproteobacteria bacterium]|nr:DUF4412 domain-containing protein [Deltaproteobacteria bacterium]
MKEIAALGASSLLLLVSAARAAEFEGVLQSRIVNVETSRLVTMLGGDATDAHKVFAVPLERFVALAGPDSGVQVKEADLKVKGSKVRLDDEAHGIYIIIDTNSGVVSIVKPKDKAYLEWTKSDRQRVNAPNEAAQESMQDQAAKKGDGKDAATAQVEAKPLGKTQTINDMKTSAFEAHSGATTVLAWITPEYKEIARIYKVFQSGDQRLNSSPAADSGIERTLAAQGLPVRVQTFDPSGYHIRELLGIEKKALASDLFSAPADYAKRTLEDTNKAAAAK